MSKHYSAPNLSRFAGYEQACREFRPRIPEQFNIADAVCRKHPDYATRTALVEIKATASNTYTFGALNYLSNRFANVLAACAVEEGDTVAVILPQSAALAIAHLAALKRGAVVAPFAMDAKREALSGWLKARPPKALVCDQGVVAQLDADAIQAPGAVFVVTDDLLQDGLSQAERNFWRETYEAATDFKQVKVSSSSAAFEFASQAAASNAASVIQSHGWLAASLPAFEMCSNFDLGEETIFWTPADWASASALLSFLYPAWFYGRAALALDARSAPSAHAVGILSRYPITHAFIPSNEIGAFAQEIKDGASPGGLRLRSVITAARWLDPKLCEWSASLPWLSLGTVYESAELGAIAASCERWFAHSAGSVGKPAPGHAAAILDESGKPLSANQSGRVALRVRDRALQVWRLKNSGESVPALSGDYIVSPDRGFIDKDGYLRLEQ